MCGIYAVQGKRASERVFAGLKRLEYRGYDSWGIAALNAHAFVVHKEIGTLPESFTEANSSANVAIGHTRWATHGGVTKTNAHPHLAKDGSFAVVHNGVIENYQSLKKTIINDGVRFVSETDTEIIVRLLEKELKKSGEKQLAIETVITVYSHLEGRNTFAVLLQEGDILAVRNGSPLIIAKNDEGDYFLSSDTLSVAPEATSYSPVENGIAVAISDDSIRMINIAANREYTPKFDSLTIEAATVDHDGYASFMEKEIHEQAEVLTRVLQNDPELFNEFREAVEQARQVWVIGAGSAYFASGQIAYLLREAAIVANAIPAYEARSFLLNIDSTDLVIAISQSGETADTLEVIEWVQEKGVPIGSLVNMAGSTLTQLSDYPFMLNVGPEIAVASTKAFVGQVVWGKAVSEIISSDLKLSELREKIHKFEQKLLDWLLDEEIQNKTQKLATQLAKLKDVFLLGKGQLYFAALEGALKLKEISYIHAEGFSGGELKHGVIALIEKDMPVFVLIATDEERSSMLSAAAEVAARGGKVIGIATEDNELFTEWLPIPADDFLAMPAAVIPFQLLTCQIARIKGRNPDKPRNLAKSVTVK